MSLIFSISNFLFLYSTINNESNKYHRMIRAIIYLIINKENDTNLIILSLNNLYKTIINSTELINSNKLISDKELKYNITNLNVNYSNFIIYNILIKIYNNT